MEAEVEFEARPVWKPDDSSLVCDSCQVEFSLTTRRHHCRSCGGLFCYSCSDFWTSIPKIGYSEVEPTCYACHLKALGLQKGQKWVMFPASSSAAQRRGPLLILGGALASCVMLSEQAKELANQGFDVMLLEFPGHGARFYEKLDEESLSASIAEGIAQFGQKVTLLGYSMGGFAAMKLKDLNNIRALIIGGCCYGGKMLPLKLAGVGYKIMSRRQTWSMIHMFFKIDSPNECQVSADQYERLKEIGMYFPTWPQCVDVMVEPEENFYLNALRNYALLRIPVTIINGELDTANSMQKEFAAAAEAKLNIIEGAKHEGVFFKHLETTIRHIVEAPTIAE